MIKTYLHKMRPKQKCPPKKPISKILWSVLGSFFGIYLIAVLGKLFSTDFVFLLGSFGASAVLIYGAPEAHFSQPRNLIGGHILSAFCGVICVKFFGFVSFEILCAVSVALSVFVMHFTTTMHPPGGATALIYVMGSDLNTLGWLYPIAPIGIGAFLMLIVALLVNNLSSNEKRHYPVYWV